MKRTMIVVLTLVLFGCSIDQGASKDPIQSSTYSVTNEPSEELKKVVESLVDVKSIEWEVVFGYPIEDVRLVDKLIDGRNIEFVVEHFEKYYEEDVLRQYLYYLKRSSTQNFLREIGVFWGDNYAVVGNVYKREAEDITYDIEYIDIDIVDDITVVSTMVTPIYHGDYNVRGNTSSEYISEQREMIFHLIKDDQGNFKLSQLDDYILESMEDEIGEEIDLNQKRERRGYYNLKKLEYESESQKVGFYFAYDALTLLNNGGLDALYDQYDKVWLYRAKNNYTDIGAWTDVLAREPSLENLRENYDGWDYAYSYEEFDDYAWHQNIEKRGEKLLAFNVDGDEITKLDFIYDTEPKKEGEILSNYEEAMSDLSEYFDEEVGLIVSRKDKPQSTDVVKEIVSENFSFYLSPPEGVSITEDIDYQESTNLYSAINKNLIDNRRRIETGKIPYWIEGNDTEYYYVYPPHQKKEYRFVTGELLAGYYCYGNCSTPLPYNTGPLIVEALVEYNYPAINLYIESSIQLDLIRSSPSERWRLMKIHTGDYELWAKLWYLK